MSAIETVLLTALAVDAIAAAVKLYWRRRRSNKVGPVAVHRCPGCARSVIATSWGWRVHRDLCALESKR